MTTQMSSYSPEAARFSSTREQGISKDDKCFIEARAISRKFGLNTVLRDCSIALPQSGIHGLIGPSGGGKSVLLKILAGVDPNYTGDVVSPIGMETTDIAFMFQEGALFDSFSVFDNVAFPLVDGNVPVSRLSSSVRKVVTEKVSTVLDAVGMLAAAPKFPGQLSGGMRRRVSLARALVAEPQIVLLDDPTAGLDPVASSVIMQLIVDSQRRTGCTALVVSQDLRRLFPICDSLFALYDGSIRFHGTLDDLRATDDEYLRAFVSARFDLDKDGVDENPQHQTPAPLDQEVTGASISGASKS